ncbi:MAG: WD40 repeat domain-containing protein, partial [Phycisphaerae bacterium]
GEGYSSLAFHPNGNELAGAAIDGVEIWDLKTRRLIQTLKGHHSRVYCVDYSPDGTRIASGGNDNTIRIWDSKSGEQLLELRGHKQYIKDVRFSPDGSQLASASGDLTLRIWDSKSRGQRLEEIELAQERRRKFQARIQVQLEAGELPSDIARSIRLNRSLSPEDRLDALRALADISKPEPSAN